VLRFFCADIFFIKVTVIQKLMRFIYVGNEGDRDKFEQYKNELFTTFNSDGYNEYVIEMIKKIKPDTYKICQLDAYIIECDDVSRYPVCDQYRTGYNFHSEDYEKYRKYFNEF